MSRLHIFIASEKTSIEHSAAAHNGAFGIITNHYAGGDTNVSVGYRPLHEYKFDPDFEDPNYPGANTHERFGPWVVCGEGARFTGDGAEKFADIVVFRCDYDPLEDSENPWHEMKRMPPPDEMIAILKREGFYT
jgi:hypothetical protein